MKAYQVSLIYLVFLSLAFSSTGCSLQKNNLPPQPISGTSLSPSILVESYKMAVGDEIHISVWKNPDLSLTEPIRPDGKISMPLVGDVMAAGLTPEQLATIIKRRLSSYIKAPNVTVILTSLQGHAFLSRIRVTGSVTKNISLTYHQGMTVLDAVLEAGSVDLYADSNNTKLHRRTKTGAETYDIRLKDIMKNGDMTTNVMLMPGDIITVPERGF
ncbi:MAG: polysaccharide biosynthesis/export family protein [Gammaproteobacteria bacterium]|nr:polysaccharide biosynthesis/export family protein [Gammaproteobacteria bacterium]